MEKKGIIKLTLLLVIVIAIISAWGLSNASLSGKINRTIQPDTISDNSGGQVAGRVSSNIVFENSFPKSVEQIMVYKVVSQHYTKEDSIALAEKFNMDNIGKTREVEEGSSIASEDGTIYAILHNSGFIEFINSNRAHTINPYDIPEKLPSDEEAIKIATEFLKERELLPEGAVFSGVTHGKIYTIVKDGEDTVDWEDIQVWFKRELNGYPVEGTQLMLAIGGGGDIIEFFTNWRTYEPYGELPVKSPEQALEELKSKGVYVGMNSKDPVVSFNDVSLVYHTNAGAYTEEYLEPVWVFKGNVMVDDKAVMDVEEYIPALTEVPTELTSK